MITSASCRIYHNRSIVNGHFFTFPSSHVSPPSSTPPSSLSIGRGSIHVNGLIMSVLRPRARGADSMLSADVGSLYEAGPGEGAWQLGSENGYRRNRREAGPGEGAWQLVSGPTPVPGLLERGQEREWRCGGGRGRHGASHVGHIRDAPFPLPSRFLALASSARERAKGRR